MADTSSQSQPPIKVIVIGAGLGGCAAALALKHHGHDVRICEKLASFRRLGDSLGLGENALKLLRRWGGEALRGALDSIGNRAEDMRIRRWHDGEVLATQPLADMAGRIGHRGDYHEAFLKGVRDAGIPIDMGREVVSIDEDETEDDSSSSSKGGGGDDDEGAPAAARPAPPRPSVTFSDGTTLAADVVVGADGIKSRAREQVLGLADAPRSSGYACYRAYFPGALLLQQDEDDDAAGGPPPLPPSSRELLLAGGDCVNVWIGRDAHLVQNTLRGGAEFNWIITRRLAGGTGTSLEAGAEVRGDGGWARAGDMADVRALVADLDPRAAGAVARTPAAALLDWVICYRDPLPAWVARGHRVVLLGDSCHPHLPTSAQGASQAVESAAVLAVCLALAGRGGIPLATRTYEKMRFPRTRQSQTAGEDLRDRWHNALKNLDEGTEIDPESVKIRNRWLYAYDAEADAVARWEEVSGQVAQELKEGNITPLCGARPT